MRAHHGLEQDQRHDHPGHDERGDSTLACRGRFERHDDQRHERRQDHKGNDEIRPHGHPPERCRHEALETPPHEGLDQEVHAEEEWEGCEQAMVLASTHVEAGIDPDGRDHDTAHQITLR